MKKILFISPNASRTGAPILLLNLIRALQKDSNYSFDFLLKEGGTLIKDFEALADTNIFYKPVTNDLLSKVKRKLTKSKPFNDVSKLAWKSYDVVFANTITNGDILPFVRKYFKGPIISYIHELEMAAKFFTDEDQVKKLIQHTTYFLVPSLAVQTFLENKYQIDPAKISLLPYYIPKFNSKQDALEDKDSGAFKEFIVGGSGTIDWRKSPELFIQIAASINRMKPDAAIKFVWKGAEKSGIPFDRLSYDIRKCGLEGRVVLEEAGNDMDVFFKKLDVFVLTSREDPYPLVVLEAADSGVPTICFADAGGAQEFVGDDAGVIVPFLDVPSAAGAVINFYNNYPLLKTKGTCAKQKLLLKHQDGLNICKQFDSIINHVLIKCN